MLAQELLVGPYPVAIQPLDPEAECYGTYEPGNGRPTIRIVPGLDPYFEATTVFHEGLEAINDIFQLELDERHMRVLEVSVIQMLRDNPWLARGILADCISSVQVA